MSSCFVLISNSFVVVYLMGAVSWDRWLHSLSPHTTPWLKFCLPGTFPQFMGYPRGWCIHRKDKGEKTETMEIIMPVIKKCTTAIPIIKYTNPIVIINPILSSHSSQFLGLKDKNMDFSQVLGLISWSQS